MDVSLPSDLTDYVQAQVRGGAFASPSEVIQEAVRRKMEDDGWAEHKVLEAEESELSPLTSEDLLSVRNLIRQSRGSRTP